MNQVCITGNLTRDVEQRQTAGGRSVQNFCVAVNDRRKNNQTGEWEDATSFIDCVAFGKDGIAKYLTKGQKVGVSGRLNQSTWQAQDGSRRSRVEIVANNVELLGQRANGAQNSSQSSVQPMTGIVTEGLYVDDLPF